MCGVTHITSDMCAGLHITGIHISLVICVRAYTYHGDTHITSAMCAGLQISQGYTYRRIPIVTAPVTFGFSRQKGPLLSGSRYFRIVKKRLYGALIHSLFRYKRTHYTTSYPNKIKPTVYNKKGRKC